MFNILLGSSTSLSNAVLSEERKFFLQSSFNELHCFNFTELNPANNTFSPKETKEGFLNGHS